MKIQEKVLIELSAPNTFLSDLTINHFINLVRATTNFDMIDVNRVYFPQLYEENDTERDDVQILYGGDIGVDAVGHFLSIFYKAETKTVYVYDSLFRQELHEKQIQIINYRYPKREYIEFVKPKTVQNDETSCGCFAIAYTATIILGDDPATYNLKLHNLRKHIRKMFEENKLIPFPQEEKNVQKIEF